ncbi:hypothetical protein CJF42_05975 [Pseudoalteromonas sp. NBT06-2]|uniref:substrate-binding domain-containing protein n=1 Tax=Pseudoalteromonas sp. NBT06-2 TaxID=2025950 RepID=UPI000BA6A78B|nr:substrate-binding domain-containing protein [Pseudoalteromonas sp. NBT06-2]PAJ75307.1 hypothetical protein CJF42_05975 [Pseudoalteromonas sp. NBT06-2]
MKTLILIFAATISLHSLPSYAEIAVIVNLNNSVTVSAEDIKGIFLGKINSFPNGVPAIPIVQKAKTPVADEFTKKVLHKTNSQIQAYWSKLIFTGQGTSPKELQNSEKILSIVSTNPNTISYINAADITEKIRVLIKF